MHLFPVVKPGMMRAQHRKSSVKFFTLVSALALVPLLSSAPSFAQYTSRVSPTASRQMSSYGTQGYGQQLPQVFKDAAAAMQQQAPGSAGAAMADSMQSQNRPYQPDLGNASDPGSQAYKVNQLAKKAQQQRADEAAFNQLGGDDGASLDPQGPPPDMADLQQVNQSQAAAANSISDDPVSKGLSLDMRRNAQREAALSYGARGGLAKRNFEITERMKGFETVLDKVFDFRALLIKAPSGLLIEPPIIKESDRAVVVTDEGDEAAVADKVFDINKKAKIITAPRDWRQYLIQSWSQVPPPPRVLWPQNQKEQAEWDGWVAQGWEAGVQQADEIFEAGVNQLTADYNGMVRYKMLLAQEMISAPYAMHEDRGVASNANQMRVGDRAVRITGPSQFLTKANLWKPANQ